MNIKLKKVHYIDYFFDNLQDFLLILIFFFHNLQNLNLQYYVVQAKRQYYENLEHM